MDKAQIAKIVTEVMELTSKPEEPTEPTSYVKDCRLVMSSFSVPTSMHLFKMRVQNLLSNMNLKPTGGDVNLFAETLINSYNTRKPNGLQTS